MKNKRIELINLKDITDGGNANSTLTGGLSGAATGIKCCPVEGVDSYNAP
ncbi:hypothetical protein [Enterococcus diestrammenae]|uniref:Uncharacterized protein n=1 Tax=Enterococcus diestrammenae TaxID=1155073 RepID=A0ABV0F5E3_9ENTE|nr:hypothetical protein [Enterococcus diestrammenae]